MSSDAHRRAETVELAYQAALASPLALAALTTIDGPNGPEPFTPWDCQKRVINATLNNKRTVVLKPRQVGQSWAVGLLTLWWSMTHPGTTSLILSIGEREAVELLRRVRRLWDSLPGGIRSRYEVDSAQLRFALKTQHGTSSIVSLPSSSSAGRGYTVSLLVLDEAAFQPNAQDRMGALLPTMGDIGRAVMLSTANGPSGYFADTWAKSVSQDNDWNPVFIRADERPDRGTEWIERERAALGELGPQEYPMDPGEAFVHSGSNVFPPDIVLAVAEDCSPATWRGRFDQDKSGIHAVRDDGGWWEVWAQPVRGRRYLITADVCAGTGSRDSAYASVWDMDSYDQVAALHGKLEPVLLAHELMKAGRLYHDKKKRPALLMPEANSYGQSVIAELTTEAYPNVGHHNRLDKGEPDETKLLGFYTSVKSRALAIGALQNGLRDRTLGVRDPRFIEEALAFIINDSGKMEAGVGAHDDVVMGCAIAALVLEWHSTASALNRGELTPDSLPRASFYLNSESRKSRRGTGAVSYR